MILLLCGLSGAGKTTLARNTKKKLELSGVRTEIIDGDEYRKTLCKDLGFSRADRTENIRRLAFVGHRFSQHAIVPIISAINPYQEVRDEIKAMYNNVKLVHVHCPIETLLERDTKGLYKRALLPEGHPEKLKNLTGVNDAFDVPLEPDLFIDTRNEAIETSAWKLADFIQQHIFAEANTHITSFTLHENVYR